MLQNIGIHAVDNFYRIRQHLARHPFTSGIVLGGLAAATTIVIGWKAVSPASVSEEVVQVPYSEGSLPGVGKDFLEISKSGAQTPTAQPQAQAAVPAGTSRTATAARSVPGAIPLPTIPNTPPVIISQAQPAPATVQAQPVQAPPVAPAPQPQTQPTGGDKASYRKATLSPTAGSPTSAGRT